MRKFKDKQQEILESELTVVGLLFVMLWLLLNLGLTNYHTKHLNAQLLEVKSLVIEYYNGEKQALEWVQSLNEELDITYAEISELKQDIQQFEHLDKLKKELDRNPSE